MLTGFSNLDLGQPGSRAEDCAGVVYVDIREQIIWTIFECTKLHRTFCNVSTMKSLLQANTTLYKTL